MTLEELNALSLSDDWQDRVKAALLAAPDDSAAVEPIILRLLLDPRDTGVTKAMTEALLAARGAGAFPIILRALGREPAESDGWGECGEQMVYGLISPVTEGIDLSTTIFAALLGTTDDDELRGALDAIGFLAPGGHLQATEPVLARIRELTGHPDLTMRTEAWHALEALEADPDGGDRPDASA